MTVDPPWPTRNSRVIVVRKALQNMRPDWSYEMARCEAEAIVNLADVTLRGRDDPADHELRP